MKRIAVFGNAGGGKSTLARKLAEATGLPLHPIDLMLWRVGGAPIPHDEYLKAPADVLARDAWIIDGYGCRPSAWERFARADTLVHVDLPLAVHAAWVTKRLVTGFFRTPAGWPDGSPMIRSSLSSYRVLWPCHKHLTPKYRQLVTEARESKRVHHLRSAAEIEAFLVAVRAKALA